eukprot:63815_1
MAILLLLSSILLLLSSVFIVQGLQMGALVTIHQEHVSSIFLEEELFGIRNRTKNNILTIEIVIDEKRLTEIKHHKQILSFEITIPDYNVIIRKERVRINNTPHWNPDKDTMNIFFDEFRPWFEYELFIEALLIMHPHITSKSILGQTVEGIDIPIITLSPDDIFDSNKPGFYIQAAVHSNEWLANAATTYILNALCEGYNNNDPEITYLLENMNIFIAPTVNIDGYIYTWTGSNARNWRKNRKDNGDGSFGVDLNRNYGPDNIWCTTGASSNPSSNTYCGPAAFSEPESTAASQFIFNSTYNIKAAVDMHTTGPYILWPWGYTVEPLPQPYYDEYDQLGEGMSAAAFAVHGQNYISIPAGQWYEASGAMEDYVCAVSNQHVIAFTFEGRPIGSGSPPIVDAGQEQMAALLYLARTLIPE